MSEHYFKKSVIAKKFDIFFLKFVFYFFKAFGIATISYGHEWNNEKSSWILTFKSSRIGIIYNVVFCGSLIFIRMAQLIFFIENKVFGESHREIVINTVYVLLFGFGQIITLTVFIFQRSKIVHITNKISMLKDLASENCITEKSFFTFFFFNYLISFIINFLLYSDKNAVLLFYVVGMTVSTYAVLFLLTQYTLILKIIKRLFESVNNDLNKILLKQPVLSIQKQEKNLELDKLMYLYTCLCDVSEDISNFYSLPMFWGVLNTFINLIFSTYFSMKRLFNSNYNLDIMLPNFINIYLNIISLTTLVVFVTKTIKEVSYNFFLYCTKIIINENY